MQWSTGAENRPRGLVFTAPSRRPDSQVRHQSWRPME